MTFFYNCLLAQSDSVQNIGKQYFEMGEFFRWGHGIDGVSDTLKAVWAYKISAAYEYPDGVMAMGEMFQVGHGGLNKNEQIAFNLFVKAYEMGSGRACYNLGMAYAYGLGCTMDYEKMIYYLQEGINRNDHSSMYGMGIMFYRGWGIEQSYEQAVELFEQAAPLGSASANYYLGVCYRNGYGVAKDKQKGNEYLELATRMCPFAEKELLEENPEIEKSKKINKKEYDSPDNYLKVNNKATIKDFEGNWSGYITIYDWSGKYKLDQENIDLNIEIEGDSFTGTGKYSGEDIVINGFNNQYGIEFNSGEFNYVDHYFDTERLKIENGSFETYSHGNRIVLAGSISLFSLTKNTPERPAYIVLTKDKKEEKSKEKSVELPDSIIATIQINTKVDTTNISGSISGGIQKQENIIEQVQNGIVDTRVWPVPFNDVLYVEYNLSIDSDVEIRLISINGKQMITLSKGKRLAGLHKQQLSVSVPQGVYILQVITENQRASKRVIKK
ncbi:MAG: SEL1-like repeat protein [Candidatus Delongbacteria bacterium]|nr:SEL1-like repeat protein [Candidatus Delongbacteria bacterium]